MILTQIAEISPLQILEMCKPKLDKSRECIKKYKKYFLYSSVKIVVQYFVCEMEVPQYYNKPR